MHCIGFGVAFSILGKKQTLPPCSFFSFFFCSPRKWMSSMPEKPERLGGRVCFARCLPACRATGLEIADASCSGRGVLHSAISGLNSLLPLSGTLSDCTPENRGHDAALSLLGSFPPTPGRSHTGPRAFARQPLSRPSPPRPEKDAFSRYT